MQIIVTLVLIALAIIGLLFVWEIVTGILALAIHLLVPILIVVGIVYVLSKIKNQKGIGSGNNRTLL